MPLAKEDFFGLVDDTNPRGSDSRTISDDQHQNILKSLKQQCPNWTGAVTATHADVNGLAGQAALGTKPMPGVGGSTRIFFMAATPPPGWTPYFVDDPDPEPRMMIIGGSVPGDIGGDDNPANYELTTTVTVNLPPNTGGHGLTADENGPHTHTGTTNSAGNHSHRLGNQITGAGANVNTFNPAQQGGNFAVFNLTSTDTVGAHTHTFTIDSQGSGTAHTHPLGGTATGTGTATLTPRYAEGVLGELDA